MRQRSVLITGASRGIGRATADAFAAAGWTVIAGVRSPDSLDPFAHEVSVVRLDVTDPNGVRAAVGRAQDIAGEALDCVVNNAAFALFGAVEDCNQDAIRTVFETDFFGALTVLQAALPAMRQAGRGVAVHVSTLSGRIPLPLFGLYSAAKAALGAVSDALALELSEAGVRSVLLEVGVVRTDFARSTVISGAAAGDDPLYGPLRSGILGTLRAAREAGGLEPADVAAAVLRAAQHPDTPARVVMPDPALATLLDGEPTPERLARFFGLDVAPQ